MKRLKLRKPFGILPDWFWAGAIDAVDVLGNIVSTILLAVFGIGVALDLLVDAIQGIAALIIFEDVSVAILGTGGDALLPPPFDVFPSVSALVWAKKLNVIK